MDLFNINRYSEETVPSSQQIENEKLKNFIKKIEKRKREATEEGTISEKNSIELNLNYGENSKIQKLSFNGENNIIEPQTEKVDNETVKAVDPNFDKSFQILGEDVIHKKETIEMILPPWLAYPTIISNKISSDDAVTEFPITQLGPYLSEDIINNLKSMRITSLFPVQQIVIPWILNAHKNKPEPFRPRDICVSAPTGSGKTLAFAIPIVQLLSNCIGCKIRALIILPVNELAMQVYQVIKKLSEKINISVCLLSKSFPFAKEQEHLVEEYKGKFYSKADIVVTTPGRLVEHLHSTKGFCLKNLKFLIIDEADRIMEQVHHNWLYHLDEHVRKKSDSILSGYSTPLSIDELKKASKLPHKMLFSATLSQDPEKLKNLKLFQPKLFTSVVKSYEDLTFELLKKNNHMIPTISNNTRGEFIGKYTTPDELIEKFCITEIKLKPLTLYSLIVENNWNKFLCFTNSSDAANRLSFVLSFLLKNQRSIKELSSSLTQQKRTQVLDLFTRGKVNGLICSDALARGIDIPEVDIVISYDAPRHIKTYIHRIGRTARAGRSGTAITLLAENELQKFNEILSDAGKEINEEIKVTTNVEERYASHYSFALKALQKNLEHEKKMKIIQKNITKNKAIPKTESTDQPVSIMESLQNVVEETVLTNLKEKTNFNEYNSVNMPRKFRKNLKKKRKMKNKNIQKVGN